MELALKQNQINNQKIKARMAEWSKALDLRPSIVRIRGFEPLFVHSYKINNSITNFILIEKKVIINLI